MRKVDLTNSEHYYWGDQCEGWFFLQREDASIVREKMPAGTAEQLHLHEKSRQFFYILSGAATFVFPDERVLLGPGEGLEIPPKKPHQIRNDGAEPLEFLLFSYPSTRGDRINLEAR